MQVFTDQTLLYVIIIDTVAIVKDRVASLVCEPFTNIGKLADYKQTVTHYYMFSGAEYLLSDACNRKRVYASINMSTATICVSLLCKSLFKCTKT